MAFVPPSGVDADSYVIFRHPNNTVYVSFFKGNVVQYSYYLVSGSTPINYEGVDLFGSGAVGEEKLLNSLVVALLGIVCGGAIVIGFRG